MGNQEGKMPWLVGTSCCVKHCISAHTVVPEFPHSLEL